MIRYTAILLAGLQLCHIAGSQVKYPLSRNEKKVNGSIYLSFGWHRAFYTPSTIHFRNPKTGAYDFRLIRAKSHDDNDIAIGRGIDAPQWSVRTGYLHTATSWGFELSYDHAKYILKQGQRVRLQGTIYGSYYDQDTIIHPGLIEFEHTDGANYYMLSLVKKKTLTTYPLKKPVDLLLKIGGGIVIPRTDSKILGVHYNEHYHLAGWVVGLEASGRYEIARNLFPEFSVKTAYANYADILLYGDGRASQHWLSIQFLFTIAYQFPVYRTHADQNKSNFH